MRKSPYPIDHTLGLSWYISDLDGIGGRLKGDPEDFVVEEISDNPSSTGTGPYLICRLTKKNWDQQRAIKEIAGRLGVSHQRFGFAGTKDKRAVTTQFISIYKADPAVIQSLHIPDMTIEPVGFSDHQISLGDLKGNRFRISLSEYESLKPETTTDDIVAGLAGGVPNYFGYQRFGVQRPVTHLTGLDILRGSYEDAVRTFVSTPSTGESEEYAEGRKFYADTGDAKEALHHIPVRLSLERSLLHHLVSNPGDYAGAFHTFPRTLRSMFVSAVQSWLFNRALSMRIEEGRGLADPVEGDRIVFSDGRSDTVTTGTSRMAAMQVKRDRCRIAIFMQGSEPVQATGPDDKNMAWLMEQEGITSEMFGTASTFLETRFSGAPRSILLNSDVSIEMGENRMNFAFSLQPGQYATTLLREIMKADPIMMI
ncbi:tRNA pseudouridine(13) synthase TruD [Methanospirillum lacunae]|uniref:Probable tRNA pseudouridine synthase D n=1 Tax=Methanospirillum lacunae TaxID=668570 RepID=A0A2V2NET8_9EURY|nr:tRNA pseudouridine(13) synthase TruD [Methanospirillum lacunae]PWR73833.1 tRNA pseudouridine(13) synthase TruD [Methanospirillum lacunae]